MRKRNRVFALLLAVGLAVGLCGCGNSAVSPTSPPSFPPEEAMPELPPAPASEPALEPTPEPMPTPEPTPEPGPHGLVVATWESNTRCTVYCLNPETGSADVISRFNAAAEADGCTFTFSLVDSGFYTTKGSCFSEDFKKIAGKKRFSANGESHAGWFNTDGTFFDVTEALGLQSKSDFDEPVSYGQYGFSDGLFRYYQYHKGAEEWSDGTYTYQSVPVDNVSPDAIQDFAPVQDSENPIRSLYADGITHYCQDVTAWIDDTHCIATYVVDREFNSFIVDTANCSLTKYIPGDSRENWDGVLSPDGTMVAFMSRPKLEPMRYNYKIDIYVVPIEGGDPVKVTGDSFSLGESSLHQRYGIYRLIGWI